ncbi:c-type cytochrome [Novosphingobium sp.]|uniref:c-type cytochrome n=1 Tax=Novosphingobium sp. TaxID=1874826 RepID=UPI002FDB3C20
MLKHFMTLCAGAAFAVVAATPALLEAAPAGNPNKGAQVFARCAICHSNEPGKKGGVGPNLAGVVGRKAGSTTFIYSPAMKNATFVWTPQALDAFLTKPSAKVPGTKMAFPGLSNASDRADVIAYLASKK